MSVEFRQHPPSGAGAMGGRESTQVQQEFSEPSSVSALSWAPGILSCSQEPPYRLVEARIITSLPNYRDFSLRCPAVGWGAWRCSRKGSKGRVGGGKAEMWALAGYLSG